MFAAHGEIWADETFAADPRHPRDRRGQALVARSSDRAAPARRARPPSGPSFRVYTGNDLAIDMVAYGSDYLLGLSTFAPEAFAARDRAFADGFARVPRLERRPPAPRQRRVPRARPRVQALGRDVPPAHRWTRPRHDASRSRRPRSDPDARATRCSPTAAAPPRPRSDPLVAALTPAVTRLYCLTATSGSAEASVPEGGPWVCSTARSRSSPAPARASGAPRRCCSRPRAPRSS